MNKEGNRHQAIGNSKDFGFILLKRSWVVRSEERKVVEIK
jgi:hypothetical protein